MVSVAGQIRLTDHWGLVTEHVVASWVGEPSVATSGAARFMTKRIYADVGVAWSNHPFDNVGTIAPPVPWIEIGGRFGPFLTGVGAGTDPPSPS